MAPFIVVRPVVPLRWRRGRRPARPGARPSDVGCLLACLLFRLPFRYVAPLSADTTVAERFRWRRAATPIPEAKGLFSEPPPSEPASARAILQSVFATDPCVRDKCLAALAADPVERVLATATRVLSRDECRALRDACDARVESDVALDNVDRLPDFQVNLDQETLTRILPSSTVDRLFRLPETCGLVDVHKPRRRFSRVGVFVRRYTTDTRPYFPWHVDGNAWTANVALSPPDRYDGGRLRCLVGGRVAVLERDEGDATVHANDVCHAVAPVTRGVRYSLLLFFHNDDDE